MKKKMLMTAVMFVAALVCCIRFDRSNSQIASLVREEETVTVNLTAMVEGENIPVELELQPKEMSEEELETVFREAEKEVLEKLPGENESLEQVMSPLNPVTSALEGVVEVTWESDSDILIIPEGKIFGEVPKEGEVSVLTATLACQGRERQIMVPIRIVPEICTPEQEIQQGIQEEVSEREKNGRQESSVTLPEEYGGRKIAWRRESKREVYWLPVLVLIAGIALGFKEKEEKKKQGEKRQQRFADAYPELVSKTVILLNAGMPLSAVWEELAEGGESLVAEEIKMTLREIKGGVSEPVAYERFAQRVGIPQYRKYVSLLLQNMKKGTKHMDYLLEQEVERALEYHRSDILRRAEKAGTKLLLPMVMLLGIVMAILMIPAMGMFEI